ncbi:MAG: acetylxylan esterase [archaeon]
MKTLNIAITITIGFLLLFAAGRIINSQIEEKNWIDPNGRMVFPDRGEVKFTQTQISEGKYKIVYDSKGTDIHAHLYKPSVTNAPAVIIAPAAGAPKEGQEDFAKWLVDQGYAVLVLDQREIGETKWTAPDPQTEYDAFMQKKKETTEQLMIYDVLKAYDLMSQIEGVDENNIILEGESMGGRFAMVAAAIEPKIKGIIVISSSGYGTVTGPLKEYVDTINPDHYVNLISPRKLVMLHSPTDSVVPAILAQETYELAKEPKEFIEMPKPCNHGNCDEIRDTLLEKLEEIHNS